ncbi:MAG: hypothetical protein V4539_11040 [Bacteroidota bacterium]
MNKRLSVICGFLLIATFSFGQPSPKIVYVNDYGTSVASIRSAITAAGDSGTLIFNPGTIYTIDDYLRIKPEQTWLMYGVTLKRASETVVTLTAVATSAQLTVSVSSVPSSWQLGDHIYFYVDSSSTGGTVDTRIITGISGTTITLSNALGLGAYNSATSYAIGVKVKKVFPLVTTLDATTIPELTGITNDEIYPFYIEGGTFDGDKALTGDNVSWYVNQTIFGFGEKKAIISGCTFVNIPNDCIDGHGLIVDKCNYKNLNNSFVHLSGTLLNHVTFAVLKHTIGTIISNCTGDSSNLFLSGVYSRHSRGVIESSSSGGFVTVIGCRFSNGKNSVYGDLYDIEAGGGDYQLATRNIIIAGNYFRNYNKIFANILPRAVVRPFSKLGNINVSGNIFDSCQRTEWPAYNEPGFYDYVDSMVITGNSLINGTSWFYPLRFEDLTNIINQQTETQMGGLNVSGTVAAGSLSSALANITSIAGLQNLTVIGNSKLPNINMDGTTSTVGGHIDVLGVNGINTKQMVISSDGTNANNRYVDYLNGNNLERYARGFGIYSIVNYTTGAVSYIVPLSATLSTNAQPNITSLGAQANITVIGNSKLPIINDDGSTSTFGGQIDVLGADGINAKQMVISSDGTNGNNRYVDYLNGNNLERYARGFGVYSIVNYTTGAVSYLAPLSAILSTAAQPNITSVGTLTNLSVSGTTSTGKIKGYGSVPTVSTNGVANTSASIVGTDLAGEITFTTSNNSIAVGTMLTVTFNSAYSSPPYVTLTNSASNIGSGETSNLLSRAYVNSATGTFDIKVGAAVYNTVGGGTYKITYHVVQ